jgi:anti-sigma factor RsiW
MNAESHEIPNEWLALYYDGELDAVRREQVQAHLPGCEPCRQELAALEALSRALAVDRIDEAALGSRSALAAWRELEPRLPERTAPAPAILRWLPGLGLLMGSVLVQFVGVASWVVALAAGQFGWVAPSTDWLNDALSGWALGWFAWLVPAQWSGWGLSLLLVVVSAWLAVLYLGWLAFVWLQHPSQAMQRAESVN